LKDYAEFSYINDKNWNCWVDSTYHRSDKKWTLKKKLTSYWLKVKRFRFRFARDNIPVFFRFRFSSHTCNRRNITTPRSR